MGRQWNTRRPHSAILPVPPHKGLLHQHSQRIGCLSVFYSSCHGHSVSDSPCSSVATLVCVCLWHGERTQLKGQEGEKNKSVCVSIDSPSQPVPHFHNISSDLFLQDASQTQGSNHLLFHFREAFFVVLVLYTFSLSLWDARAGSTGVHLFFWCVIFLIRVLGRSVSWWHFVWVESRAARSRGREHISHTLWDVFPLCCTLLKTLQTVHPHFS